MSAKSTGRGEWRDFPSFVVFIEKVGFVDVCTPISEAGWTSRKRNPLGIRLKSTRPSHGRFYSFHIPPEAKQNFLMMMMSEKQTRPHHRARFASAHHQHQNPKENRPATTGHQGVAGGGYKPNKVFYWRGFAQKKEKNPRRANRHENRRIPAMRGGWRFGGVVRAGRPGGPDGRPGSWARGTASCGPFAIPNPHRWINGRAHRKNPGRPHSRPPPSARPDRGRRKRRQRRRGRRPP